MLRGLYRYQVPNILLQNKVKLNLVDINFMLTTEWCIGCDQIY